MKLTRSKYQLDWFYTTHLGPGMNIYKPMPPTISWYVWGEWHGVEEDKTINVTTHNK